MTENPAAPEHLATSVRLTLTTARPVPRTLDISVGYRGQLLSHTGLRTLGENLARRLCPKNSVPTIGWDEVDVSQLRMTAALAEELFGDWRIGHLGRKRPEHWTPSEIMAMVVARGLCLTVPNWTEYIVQGSVRFSFDQSDPLRPHLVVSFKRKHHPRRQPALV